MVRFDLSERDVQNTRGRQGVQVGFLPEGLQHGRVVGQDRGNPQFDL